MRAVQRGFDRINATLETPRDPFREEILLALLEGYRFLDQLQEGDIDLFAPGNSRRLLQLNCLVICEDPDPDLKQCAPHFRETERRFYDDRSLGGVRALMNYLADHRHPTPWRRAAGVYTQILSEPQLFFEGNHRTGVLLMSHILLRAGLPPCVLSAQNIKTCFDLSSRIKDLSKRRLRSKFALLDLSRRLAERLEANADARYLLDWSAPALARRAE
nr:hypothetical protein [Thiocystis violacea]